MSIIDEADRDLKALLQKCKVTDVKIGSVWNVEYPEEEQTMSEQQTFKNLIGYKGHTYLMAITIEFQPISPDLKEGYVPFVNVINIKEVNLEDEADNEDD
jgi:hypothetical protein